VTEQTILITGAAGRIGRALRPRLARAGRTLRLLDTQPPEPAGDGEPAEVLPTASITDLDAMRAACRGVDAVIHLAAIANEDTWERILSMNVDGTRSVLEAARQEGVGRVVLASSIHAVGFVRRSEAPPDGLPAGVLPRPDTYYGVSKAVLESLGSLYHYRYGMAVVCLRIGAFSPRPVDTSAMPMWLSPDDMARLAEASLTADGYRIVWGISRNTRRWWSLAAGDAIGYRPMDDSEAYADQVRPPPRKPDDDRIGGFFCDAPLGRPM
jgi:uronate dehydrogenase